jgi:membrane fusion protein (multidrug efflux system)
MKKILTVSVFTIIVTALVLVKIFAFPEQKAKVAAQGVVPAIPVECIIARDTVADYQLETVGTLLAREQVGIVSEIQRKLVGIYLTEGAHVKAGQLLFKLDDSDITARIRKLEIQAGLAEANAARDKVLLDSGGISQERFDAVDNQAKVLRAEIDILKVDLAKTEIRAPFDGRVGIRNVSLGALITPGQVLADLQDVDRINLDFSVPERYAPDVTYGSAVSFLTDYLPAERKASVEAVQPSVDQQTRTLLVRSAAVNTDGRLVPGSSAKVFLTIRGQSGSIMVPTQALLPSIRGYSVYLVRGGKAVMTVVKTGNRNSELVQVLEGVAHGDTVVTTNLLRVRNQSPITIQKVN